MPRSTTRILTKRQLKNFRIRDIHPRCGVKIRKRGKKRCGKPARSYVTKPWYQWTSEDLPQPKWYCREHAKELIPSAVLLGILRVEKARRDERKVVEERRRASEARQRAKNELDYHKRAAKKTPNHLGQKRHGGRGVLQAGSVNRRKADRRKTVRK